MPALKKGKVCAGLTRLTRCRLSAGRQRGAGLVKLLYLNSRAWRVRLAQAAIWLGAGLCAWLAFIVPPNPTDGPADQLVVLIGAILMIAATLAFEVFLRLYVLRIEREGGVLQVTTLATCHHRRTRLDTAATSLGETRREQAPAFLAPGYNNSWRALKAKGHLFPFIVDTTAHEAR